MMENLITKAVVMRGRPRIAKACDVTPQCVRKWERFGLPLTELSTETEYSKIIEKLTDSAITEEQLKAWLIEHRKTLKQSA